MYPSIKKITNVLKGKNSLHVKIVSTGLFSAFSYSAWNYAQSHTKANRVHEWFTAWKSQSIAKCARNDDTQHSTSNSNVNICETTIPGYDDVAVNFNPPENELRIIILGATGSGKSSAGNHLLQNKEGFKTSCFAKSETLKSTLRTSTWEKDSKTFKIDIIDTPAYADTGLKKEDVECEIKKAIALSAPGPHAFLLCIPATSITDRYKEVIEPYEKYFKDISDFTIVTLTKYDQLESGCCNKKDTKLYNVHLSGLPVEMKHDMIILRSKNQGDNIDDLIDKIIKRKKVFASCQLSEHAEHKLQETISNIRQHRTIMEISRDIAKMLPDFSKHFTRGCRYCD